MFSGWQPAAGFYIPDQGEWDPARSPRGPSARSRRRSRRRATATPMVCDPDRQPHRAVRRLLLRRDSVPPPVTSGSGTARPGPGRTHARRDRVRRRALPQLVYDSVSQEDRALRRQHRHGRAGRHLGRRDLGVGRGRGHLDQDHTRPPRCAYLLQATTSSSPTTPAAARSSPTSTTQYVCGAQSDHADLDRDHGDHVGRRHARLQAQNLPLRSVAIVHHRLGRRGSEPRTLYEYTGSTAVFTNRSTPVNGPVQREYPQVAYDSMRGKLILFGGYKAGSTASTSRTSSAGRGPTRTGTP